MASILIGSGGAGGSGSGGSGILLTAGSGGGGGSPTSPATSTGSTVGTGSSGANFGFGPGGIFADRQSSIVYLGDAPIDSGLDDLLGSSGNQGYNQALAFLAILLLAKAL